jgi:hypothetical protein
MSQLVWSTGTSSTLYIYQAYATPCVLYGYPCSATNEGVTAYEAEAVVGEKQGVLSSGALKPFQPLPTVIALRVFRLTI